MTTPQIHDNANIQDQIDFMEHIDTKLKSMNIEYNLYGYGVSMGANLLLKYCGMVPDKCKFDAVVSFNNPFDVWFAVN